MKKVLNYIASLILSALMVFTSVSNMVLPVSAEDSGASSAFSRTVLIDCGRVYYTVDQLKTIIDEAAKDDYSEVMLLFGNDGLRFLLDDMSVTVNGTTYSSDTIKNAIKAQNQQLPKNNYSGIAASSKGPAGTGELSQADMDAIIAYANSKGVAISPGLDFPGHATSIIAAMDAVGIENSYVASRNGSNDDGSATINITNSTAYNFTMALLQKYINYFQSKGSKRFNIGTDEFAGNMGSFNATEQPIMEQLLTDACNKCTAAGMTPLAFADKIKGLTVPKTLVGIDWQGNYLSGNSNINANSNWYYNLSKSGDSSLQGSYQKSLAQVAATKVTTTRGGETPIGSMLCIWADWAYCNPTPYIQNILTLMDTQSSSNPNYFVKQTTQNVTVEAGKSVSYPVHESASAPVSEGSKDTSNNSIATAKVGYSDGAPAIRKYTGELVTGNQYVIALTRNSSALTAVTNGNGRLTLNGAVTVDSEKWTWTGNGFKTGEGKYLTVGSKTSTVSDTPSSLTVDYNSTVGAWEIGQNGQFLNQYGGQTSSEAGGYTAGAADDAGSRWNIYEVYNDTSVQQKVVTITGVAEGTATATVGRTVYNITVTPSTEPTPTPTPTSTPEQPSTPEPTSTPGTTGDEVTINLEVGEKVTRSVDSSITSKNYETNPSGIATAVVTHTDGETIVGEPVTSGDLSGEYIISSYPGSTSVSSNDALVLTSAFQASSDKPTGLKISGYPSSSSETWALTKADGNNRYYIQNSAKKYLTIGSNSAAITDTPTVLVVTTTGAYDTWQISDNAQRNYLNYNGGKDSAVHQAAGFTNSGVGGQWSRWRLQPVTRIASGSIAEFTGVKGGKSDVVIGSTTYHLVVQNEPINITMYVGQTASEKVDASIDENADYNIDSSIATLKFQNQDSAALSNALTSASQLKVGAKYVIALNRSDSSYNNHILTSNAASGSSRLLALGNTASISSETWTYTGTGFQNAAGKYLDIGNSSATLSDDESNLALSYIASASSWQIGKNVSGTTYYLNQNGGRNGTSAGGWTQGAANDPGSCWNIYELKEAGKTAVFEGVSSGTTDVTIGYQPYHITVRNEDVSGVTLTYYPFVSTYALYQTKQASYPTEGTGNPQTLSASLTNVNSQNGVALSEFVWPEGRWVYDEQGYDAGFRTVYWKGVVHTDSSKKQAQQSFDGTVPNGADHSLDGEDFYYIRYLNGKWSTSVDRQTWNDIPSQAEVCVYYLQKTNITQEITTYVKDWAYKTSDYNSYTDSGASPAKNGGHKALSVAVVYPDGTISPVNEDIYDKSTMIYWARTGVRTDTSTLFTRFEHSDDYDISKITYTFGTISSESASGGTLDWDKKTTADGDSWFDETTYWENGVNQITGKETEPVVQTSDFLEGTQADKYGYLKGDHSKHFHDNKDALLLLVYVHTIHGQLTVHYVDKSNDDKEFYKYSIDSTANETFKTNIALNDADWNQDLTNGDVVNKNGVTQKVSAKLSSLVGIDDTYLQKHYTCTSIARSDDGKDLYLYYVLPDSFVVPTGIYEERGELLWPLAICLAGCIAVLIEAKRKLNELN